MCPKWNASNEHSPEAKESNQLHEQQTPHLPQLEQSSSSSCVESDGNRVNMTRDEIREGFFLVSSATAAAAAAATSDMCTPGRI